MEALPITPPQPQTDRRHPSRAECRPPRTPRRLRGHVSGGRGGGDERPSARRSVRLAPRWGSASGAAFRWRVDMLGPRLVSRLLLSSSSSSFHYATSRLARRGRPTSIQPRPSRATAAATSCSALSCPLSHPVCFAPSLLRPSPSPTPSPSHFHPSLRMAAVHPSHFASPQSSPSIYSQKSPPATASSPARSSPRSPRVRKSVSPRKHRGGSGKAERQLGAQSGSSDIFSLSDVQLSERFKVSVGGRRLSGLRVRSGEGGGRAGGRGGWDSIQCLAKAT